jgi:hypothetical protein
MNPRAQFFAIPKSMYSGGVLFFTQTQNKFWLPDFFEFSLNAVDTFTINSNTLQVSVNNAPAQFTRDNGLTFYFNNPFETLGQVITLDWKYIVGDNNTVIREYSTRTKLKIVVRSQPL